jgi:hypothetical protein
MEATLGPPPTPNWPKARSRSIWSTANRWDVVAHYWGYRGQDYFEGLVAGTAVHAHYPKQVVLRFRELMGPYKDPPPGTIRGRLRDQCTGELNPR